MARAMVKTWTTGPTLAALGHEGCAHLLSLFEAHVDKGLAWLRNCGNAIEYLPSIGFGLVSSLTALIQV